MISQLNMWTNLEKVQRIHSSSDENVDMPKNEQFTKDGYLFRLTEVAKENSPFFASKHFHLKNFYISLHPSLFLFLSLLANSQSSLLACLKVISIRLTPVRLPVIVCCHPFLSCCPNSYNYTV